MLDKSIPYIGVLMEKYDTANYPHFDLPQASSESPGYSGYSFCNYENGLKSDWCRLQMEVEQFKNLEKADEYFDKEFLSCPEDLKEKMWFTRDNKTGDIVGTISLWHGNHFGMKLQRLHWLTVSPSHQGRGIAKALTTKLFDIYNKLGYSGYIYLTSQTWSYKALNLYMDFGFKPYMGEKPVNWICKEDFNSEKVAAWDMIMRKMDTPIKS